MTILVITTSYSHDDSGRDAAGGFVSDFCIELAKKSAVIVIAPALQSSETNREGITVIRFAVPKLPLSQLRVWHPYELWCIIQTLILGLKAARRICQGTSVKLVLALWTLPSGYWANKLKQEFGIPFATWSLGSDIWSLKSIPFVRGVLKKVLSESVRNFADGIQLSRDVEALSNQECHFLPSSRNFSVRRDGLRNSPPYRLTFLGRWHKNKGIDILLDALAFLDTQSVKNIEKITIAGGGPLDKLVSEKILDLSKRGLPIEKKGYMSKHQAEELFSVTDIVLIPSRIESIPVIFSDALKAHCLVVAMPVGDLPILLKDFGYIGVLANKVEAYSFAAAIDATIHLSISSCGPNLEIASNQFDLQQSVNPILALLDDRSVKASQYFYAEQTK